MNPTFKFSDGGATERTLTNFIAAIEKEFGAVTAERMVDFCICVAYAFRSTKKWSIKQVFGKMSVKRLKENGKANRYYEDKWLSSISLNRQSLISMIADRSVHPQAKFIHVAAEEPTKKRMLGSEVGYVICQTSTLGWSPLSENCAKCPHVDKCRKETERKYPELYRIRVEYGNKRE